jgi:hypothetical protein
MGSAEKAATQKQDEQNRNDLQRPLLTRRIKGSHLAARWCYVVGVGLGVLQGHRHLPWLDDEIRVQMRAT